MSASIKKFEVGQKYFARFVTDHDTIVTMKIVKRTPKTVWTDSGKSFRVSEYEGVEQFMPLGRYSMAPIMDASKKVVE